MKTNESTAENGSAPVGLNLELGHGSDHRTKSCGFTVLQLQELQLQALVYKYMEAALPVPYHLLLPLWKSVASSLGGLNDAVPSGHTSCKYPMSRLLSVTMMTFYMGCMAYKILFSISLIFFNLLTVLEI